MKFVYPEGATPLEPDELQDLIPTHITLQNELDDWEQRNIAEAAEWALNHNNILTLDFIKKLHLHMFYHTWKWAGKFRRSEKNIGIAWHHIPMEIRKLCHDVTAQMDHHSFSDDEIAVRMHHRLVWIHPFPNGNGRHARLMADLLIQQIGHPAFTWGINKENKGLTKPSEVRMQYINGLRLADKGDFSQLIVFARA